MKKGGISMKKKKSSDELGGKRMSKWAEKLDMYDMIAANLYAGSSIVEPDTKLDRSHIDIGFSNIASEKYIIKYFVVNKLPDWLDPKMFDNIRFNCIKPGVRVNFYIYGQPHKINWDSSEMKNRMDIWKNYTKNMEEGSVFEYRKQRDDILAKQRIIDSTGYLNKAELDYKRTLMKVSIMIELACKRDDESLAEMDESIKTLKRICSYDDIRLLELKVNMLDWMQQLSIFSLKHIKEVYKRMTKRIVTDDILANLNSYKQGRIGDKGTPFGIDISSRTPIMIQLKADPDAAENILIAGGTGSGKSLYVKVLLTWLLATMVVTVLDYEGDEYTDLVNFIRGSNPNDAIVVSMGKGSAVYFDPMEIEKPTGEPDIDSELKSNAMNYTTAMFRLMIAGTEGELDMWQMSVLSEAIKTVYEDHNVTDDPSTWKYSKGLRIRDVYEEIKDVVERQDYIDEVIDNAKHKAAIKIVEACRTFFEDGETKSGTFKQPLTLDDLVKRRLIVFSFGMKGADMTQMDPVILGLKQLSVSNLSSQISNHCKYVKHCFNVKIWEEYQRWGVAKGSAEIIGNAMTGGRKRGDVNFIITNDLSNMLDEANPINARLAGNLTGYIIGAIPSRKVRDKFCSDYSLPEMRSALERIYKASTKKTNAKGNSQNRYKYSFCVIMNSGEKAIVRQYLPPALMESNLFRTGVKVD